MRKVLGASIGGIVLLLCKDFIKLVLVACIIAIPVSYFVMNNWLQDFAYRIKISPTTFILGALLAFTIALITISVTKL